VVVEDRNVVVRMAMAKVNVICLILGYRKMIDIHQTREQNNQEVSKFECQLEIIVVLRKKKGNTTERNPGSSASEDQ